MTAQILNGKALVKKIRDELNAKQRYWQKVSNPVELK